MVLNYIWIAFFFVAFVVALIKAFVFGDMDVFSRLVKATFDSAELGFTISIGLTGVLSLWLGIMKVGERGGVIALFSKAIGPLFRQLFPKIPKGHPAIGSILMNISANMLGLDNAATPLGLKAMKEMQDLNEYKDKASDPQIMFLVLNTSGLTIIPISIMVYRAKMGAVDPSDVFIPILLATFFSTLAGLITVGLFQRLKLWHPVVLAYIGGLSAVIVGSIYVLSRMPQEQMNVVSSLISNVILFGIIIFFFTLAAFKRVNIYEAFVEGAKDGFTTAITIIPYLVAMLVGIAVFRASGAMDYLVEIVRILVTHLGFDTRFVDALPTAFMKPLSGSGSRGMMVDAMKTFGADSFVGRLTCIIQGSADTTFYVIAVYFGSVGIRNTRYAITAGLIADIAGLIASVAITYYFFG
jgi:spore maturation protein SpmA